MPTMHASPNPNKKIVSCTLLINCVESIKTPGNWTCSGGNQKLKITGKSMDEACKIAIERLRKHTMEH